MKAAQQDDTHVLYASSGCAARSSACEAQHGSYDEEQRGGDRILDRRALPPNISYDLLAAFNIVLGHTGSGMVHLTTA